MPRSASTRLKRERKVLRGVRRAADTRMHQVRSTLFATAKFCPECANPTGLASELINTTRFNSPQSYTPKYIAEKILTSKTALEGERKQVTVIFADISGCMDLLADRDAEEARKLIDPVLDHMMEAVHRYEGTVNQVMGDGIMALFGAPLAHEDHAVYLNGICFIHSRGSKRRRQEYLHLAVWVVTLFCLLPVRHTKLDRAP